MAQYGVDCLVLDRWQSVYPQPRAVHLDDEICRIIGRLGIADEFAAISRPALGLQLRDRAMRVLAQFQRDSADGAHGYPQANMFDQPEFETLLRANLKRYPHATLRANSEVTDVAAIGADRVRVTFTDRLSGQEHSVDARLRARLRRREQRGARRDRRVDATTCDFTNAGSSSMWRRAEDLHQWDGVHQVCDPHRARNVHADRGHPVPVGVPVTAWGDRRRTSTPLQRSVR